MSSRLKEKRRRCCRKIRVGKDKRFCIKIMVIQLATGGGTSQFQVYNRTTFTWWPETFILFPMCLGHLLLSWSVNTPYSFSSRAEIMPSEINTAAEGIPLLQCIDCQHFDISIHLCDRKLAVSAAQIEADSS